MAGRGRPHVPQFGKWEGEGNNNIPYTVVFDKAREGRGGKMINPNDPQQNPEAFRAPQPKPQTRQPEQPRRAPTQASNGRRSGDGVGEHTRKSSTTSIGSEHSVDRSPLNQYKPKVTGRGTGSSPAHETNNKRNVKGTPGRSPLDDGLDRGVAVPAFGGWDEKDMNAGAGLTSIFNQVREEKNTGTPNITMETHDYARPTPNNSNTKAKKSFFPCFG